MGAGHSASLQVGKVTKELVEPHALRRAEGAKGLWSGWVNSAANPVPLTLQSFVLRPHYMNCSMFWVSLHSFSRSGGIAPQDPEVNERNEGNVFPCQLQGIM